MLYDAHCHPTETPGSLPQVASMDAELCIMSTRPDDIELVRGCAVYPNATLAFGLHPWWSYLLSAGASKADHYRSVLKPEPDDSEIEGLPEPIQMSEYLSTVTRYLEEAPSALVGEVGLDKAFRVRIDGKLTRFRVDMAHQKLVLAKQLEIAQNLQRRVSVHGVQAAGALFETISQFALPAICLHSYSGSAEFYTQQWLKLPFPVYVSGAVIINMPDAARAREVLRGVPPERVLSESDYGEAGHKMMHLLQKSQDMIANIYGWSPAEASERLKKNFIDFVKPPPRSPPPPGQSR